MPTAPPLVGRTNELSELDQRLSTVGVHTLTGPPGVGKSRLAHEVARQFGGSAVICEVSSLQDESGLIRALTRRVAPSRSIGAPREPNLAEVADILCDEFRGGLVVLDNVEPCVEVVRAFLPELLALWHEARILVTSREVLGLSVEHVLELTPLSTAATPEGDSEAAELFCYHVTRLRGRYDPTPAERAAVHRVVAQLDGIPLALALAADRMRIMDAEQLDEELQGATRADASLDPSSVLTRAIEASWRRLSPWERSALAQCTVFEDSFDAPALNAVIDLGSVDDSPATLDVVTTLRNKSLIQMVNVKPLRLSLLSSVRHFAAGHLPSDAAAEHRHAEHYLQRLKDLSGRVDSGVIEEVELLIAEEKNLEAIVNRGVREHASEHDARLAIGALVLLSPLQWVEGPREAFRETYRCLIEKLSRADDASGDLSRAYREWSRLERVLGNVTEARQLADRALELRKEASDWDQALIERLMGVLLVDQGKPAEAIPYLLAANEGFANLKSSQWQARALASLGRAWAASGDAERAEQAVREAAELRTHANTAARWFDQIGLAHRVMDEGRVDEAERLIDAAEAGLRGLDTPAVDTVTAQARATLTHLRGDLERALEEFKSAERNLSAGGHPRHSAVAQGCVGLVLLELGRTQPALTPLRDAVRRLSESGIETMASVFGTFLSSGLAELGRLEIADETLTKAEDGIPEDATVARRIALAMRASLELERLKAATEDLQRDAALTHEAVMRQHLSAARADAPRSLDLRIALRYVQNRIDRARREGRLPSSTPTVTIHLGGHWFRLAQADDAQRTVSFATRPVMARMLAVLATQLRDHPGEALSHEELIAATWPEERMTGRSGTERVYATIKRLRREGLSDILEAADDGFRLKPRPDIAVSGTETPPP